MTYFGGSDIPVFLLGLFSKGEKDNLSKAERNTAERTRRTGRRLQSFRAQTGYGNQVEEHTMSKMGKRLIAAANGARAIARGEADPAIYRVHVPTDVDVAGIRKKLELSRSEFAARLASPPARCEIAGKA